MSKPIFSVPEESIHLGMGIVLFKGVINMDEHKDIIPYLSSLKDKATEEDFHYIKDENGEVLYAINRSGHRYSLEDVRRACSHIVNFANGDVEKKYVDFFEMCEEVLYQCLIRYVERYPMMLPCLWWRTQGHVVAYGPGSDFGMHCDNDINYQPGAEPDQQLAIRNVVGGLIYFNTSVESNPSYENNEFVGGKISFPYAEVEYSPCAGDVIMFPSNYLATHEVKPCIDGNRYAYVGYFAQGSNHVERGVNIKNKDENTKIEGGQLWIPNLFNDYINYIEEKYDPNIDGAKIHKLLFSTKRYLSSKGTTGELS